jgi:putative transposase
MPRIARVCAAGCPHHITQRGNNKEKVFFDDEDRRLYLDILQRYKNKYGIKILAYCLMGNHVHILVAPGQEMALARAMGGTNLVYTQHVNRKYNRSGRLWQNRFFSSVVEEESYLWAVMRYMEQNPVRARLVKKAEGYPWSSARAHVLGVEDDVVSRENGFKEKEIRSYREFLREEQEEINAAIRRATSTGRPLGGEGFIRKLEKRLNRDLFPKKGGRPKGKRKK